MYTVLKVVISFASFTLYVLYRLIAAQLTKAVELQQVIVHGSS